MNFTTKVPLLKSKNPIDYNSKIMSLGSCFAVNISEKFDYFKFQNTCNPFGILFHPLAIEKLIHFAVSQKQFSESAIFFQNELWHCYDAHSDLSNANKEELIANLNMVITSMLKQISNSTHLIITYGTSWVYRNRSSNSIVANCHKVPQKEFEKEILGVDTIAQSIKNTIASIQKINPDCEIIFTISPVRHLKDGFVENQLSKAHLITAIQQILNPKSQNLNYFPSYEIMMDELRDYRFYAEDMIHPSQIAIDYIWEQFAETHISPETHSIMEEVGMIKKGLAHRPFNPDSKSHMQFMEKLGRKTRDLESKFPQIQF
ncbi:GSCFA domain-containing protein [Flavobacterium cellulosilyticum]|uniref:GSCFA domain-containing protein n=1 Tax=Flavobacterium cellulosilyticum TaxID=2541731 RepID=A0A4R5C411_9FLAO|nr:GSCFA domain-containing protein [Flavobacterium cellulosilyticum]TDD94411.1 GSCFA domain-containing protein [Flavobacterium cellulosilyticum]